MSHIEHCTKPCDPLLDLFCAAGLDAAARIDNPFLARDLAVSAPRATPLYGEYDEELLFEVTYRSRRREITGAPPGPRHWFVYAGRDAGGRWWILSQGTGP